MSTEMKATTYPTTWRHNHPWIERVSGKKKQKEEGCVVVVVAQAVDGAATKTVAPVSQGPTSGPQPLPWRRVSYSRCGGDTPSDTRHVKFRP